MTRLWDEGKVTAHTRYRWGQVGGWCGPLYHTEGREQPPGQPRQGTSRWGMYVSWLSRYRGLISTFSTVRSSCREYAHGNEAVCEGGKSGFSRFSPCHTLMYVCMRGLWPKILLRCVCERERKEMDGRVIGGIINCRSLSDERTGPTWNHKVTPVVLTLIPEHFQHKADAEIS